MEKGLIILFVGSLVFLAHLLNVFFERTKIPDVLSLIVVGLLLGPILQLVDPTDFGKVGNVFITIALVIILFHGGLELGIGTLRSSIRRAFLLTAVAYVVSFVVLVPICMALTGFTLAQSSFVAAVLAGPAPALVIPLVRQLRISTETRTSLTLESALGEALCIIISLAVINIITKDEVRVGEVAGKLIASFLLAAVIGGLSGFGWSILLNRIRQLQHALFTTPAFVFIVFGLTETLGYSGPVAALAFGVTMGNAGLLDIPLLKKYTQLSPADHDETEIRFFGELVFLLKTFFFVFLGLSIKLTDVTLLLQASALVLAMLAGRYIAVLFARDRALATTFDVRTMIVLIPRGTAAAVLGSLPAQRGLESAGQIQDLIFGVVFLSIFLTSILVTFVARAEKKDPALSS